MDGAYILLGEKDFRTCKIFVGKSQREISFERHRWEDTAIDLRN
jgi:hypothetical protein